MKTPAKSKDANTPVKTEKIQSKAATKVVKRESEPPPQIVAPVKSQSPPKKPLIKEETECKLHEFEQFINQKLSSVAPSTTPQKSGFSFVPTSKHVQSKQPDSITQAVKSEAPVSFSNQEALMNMKTEKFSREDAKARAGMLIKEETKKEKITLEKAAFGGHAIQRNISHDERVKDKVKQDKVLMNEQNWSL